MGKRDYGNVWHLLTDIISVSSRQEDYWRKSRKAVLRGGL